MDPWSGQNPPKGTKVAWGCRAVLTEPPDAFAILTSHQQAFGTVAARTKLGRWINTTGLPALRKKVKGLERRGQGMVSFASKGYRIEASLRRGGRFLDVGAWPVATKKNGARESVSTKGNLLTVVRPYKGHTFKAEHALTGTPFGDPRPEYGADTKFWIDGIECGEAVAPFKVGGTHGHYSFEDGDVSTYNVDPSGEDDALREAFRRFESAVARLALKARKNLSPHALGRP